MNVLKKAVVVLAVALILVMMAATIVEAQRGTAFAHAAVYGAWWFTALWGVLAVCGIIYMVRARLHRRRAVFMVHAAFACILLGAFTSWLTAETGQVHLRQGESVTTFERADSTKAELGFALQLQSFRVENYPGTDAPMDYVSLVTADGEEMQVSMNNIGTCHGYRFTQSAYDDDMQGTSLGVSHDPWGIGITYLGYALLLVSLLWMLYERRHFLRSLYRKATNPAILFLLFSLSSALPTQAAQAPAEFHHIEMDPALAHQFGRICVLYNGRVCPINTVAADFVTKLSGHRTWNGMSADEIFMGWVFDVMDWEQAPMIEVKNKRVQQLLGLSDKWARFSDFYDAQNNYKLEQPLADATRTGDQTLVKALREVDEKFNIIRMHYSGELLRMFPYTDEHGQMTWLSPGEKNVHSILPPKEWNFVRRSMDVMAEAVISGNTERASEIAQKIYDYQHIRGEEVIPSRAMVYVELAYNWLVAQRWIVFTALTLSLLLAVGAPLMQKHRKLLGRTSRGLLIVLLTLTATTFLLRWLISGHLPLSNGFETMQFLALTALIITAALRRRLPMLEPFGLLLASLALLVAMITDGNPQITPLMPVLQSPLLSVHVMTIMFAYALLALMALLSAEGLLASARGRVGQSEQLAALSRLLLYPAVVFLAIGIFIGAVWANVSWGRYWSWDSKETWALITLLIYAAPLHQTLRLLNRTRAQHWYLLLAFLSVLMTYFGVNYFLVGLHSYA